MRKLTRLLTLVLLFFATPIFAATGPVLNQLCADPRFVCAQVKPGETWDSLFADYGLRTMVMHINRINTPLRTGMVIAIPKEADVAQLNDLSPFSRKLESNGKKTLVYDPTLLAWAAYDENGDLIRWGAGSGGSDWCRDLHRPCHTSVGTHTVYSAKGENCRSSIFPLPRGGAPMPYCMYFSNGQAFHGGPEEVLGFNASHGCVRVFVEDAQWLYEDFVDMGTRVIIRPYGGSSSQSVWDEQGT